MEIDYKIIWIFILIFILWLFTGKLIYETYVNKKEKRLNEKLDKIENENLETIKKAQNEAAKIIEQANKYEEKKNKRLEILEERISKKEELLEKKISEYDEKKELLSIDKKKLKEDIENQQKILSKISWFSKEEAKKYLFDMIEVEYSKEITKFINKQKLIKQELANKEAANIISKVLPRIWMNQVSEFTVSIIDIENESVKWKIIWKEWRNISFFEKITWAEIIIDDTPWVVNVSCFDPEKRYVASETLRLLLKDWRINPVNIEKVYNDVLWWMDEFLLEKWKEALSILNLPMMNPDVMKMIWQFYFRYSYWQNLFIHSIEVARISEWIANELWLDWILAKKAWLLHDIWKLRSWTWLAHAKVWWEILRQYWFDPVIINAAEWHHFDVELTDPISWIVTAADAISAARPWARFNTKNMFIERMENLEKLVSEFSWINKVYIMQAWREIMTFVDSEIVNDLELEKLVKNISSKIESQLDYPWTIRIVWIRENRVVSYIN